MSERIHPQASRYGNAYADLNQQTGRDVRLDLFRGLSLFFIFIDHIPNNVLSYVTLRSIGFSDAAEVFVFNILPNTLNQRRYLRCIENCSDACNIRTAARSGG